MIVSCNHGLLVHFTRLEYGFETVEAPEWLVLVGATARLGFACSRLDPFNSN